MEKMTKKMMYEVLVQFAETGTLTITADELKAFAEKEIAALDRKADRAKAKAAEKRAAADPIIDAVKATLTAEYQTLADIAAQIDIEDVSVAKVQSRMTKLVDAGVAVREDIKIDIDGKAVARKGYRLAD